MDELKACPFCECKAKRQHMRVNKVLQHFVQCETCGVSTGVYDTEGEAVETWNRRPEEKRQSLTLEDLAERIHKPVWVETMEEWRIVVMGSNADVRLCSMFNNISARHALDSGGRIYDTIAARYVLDNGGRIYDRPKEE